MSYAKAAEAAEEAAARSRKTKPLNRQELEEQEVASDLAAVDRPVRESSGIASEAFSRAPLSTIRSPMDNVWFNGADRLRSKVPSPILGSIDQGEFSINSAGSTGLQTQASFGDNSFGGSNQGYRTEYDSSRVKVFNP